MQKGYCYLWTLAGGFNEASSMKITQKSIQNQPHKRYALKCLISPDSTLIATSSADCMVKIFRSVDFSPVRECKDVNQKWVWDMAFSCDSSLLFTASSDKVARLWRVQTGQVIREYTGHQKPIVCLAYSDVK
jgi:target of rapamycin complex subunit LST8